MSILASDPNVPVSNAEFELVGQSLDIASYHGDCVGELNLILDGATREQAYSLISGLVRGDIHLVVRDLLLRHPDAGLLQRLCEFFHLWEAVHSRSGLDICSLASSRMSTWSLRFAGLVAKHLKCGSAFDLVFDKCPEDVDTIFDFFSLHFPSEADMVLPALGRFGDDSAKLLIILWMNSVWSLESLLAVKTFGDLKAALRLQTTSDFYDLFGPHNDHLVERLASYAMSKQANPHIISLLFFGINERNLCHLSGLLREARRQAILLELAHPISGVDFTKSYSNFFDLVFRLGRDAGTLVAGLSPRIMDEICLASQGRPGFAQWGFDKAAALLALGIPLHHGALRDLISPHLDELCVSPDRFGILRQSFLNYKEKTACTQQSMQCFADLYIRSSDFRPAKFFKSFLFGAELPKPIFNFICDNYQAEMTVFFGQLVAERDPTVFDPATIMRFGFAIQSVHSVIGDKFCAYLDSLPDKLLDLAFIQTAVRQCQCYERVARIISTRNRIFSRDLVTLLEIPESYRASAAQKIQSDLDFVKRHFKQTVGRLAMSKDYDKCKWLYLVDLLFERQSENRAGDSNVRAFAVVSMLEAVENAELLLSVAKRTLHYWSCIDIPNQTKFLALILLILVRSSRDMPEEFIGAFIAAYKNNPEAFLPPASFFELLDSLYSKFPFASPSPSLVRTMGEFVGWLGLSRLEANVPVLRVFLEQGPGHQ